MNINNIRIFTNNRLQYGSIKFRESDNYIEEIHLTSNINPNAPILTPAFIDIHCHGGFGYEVMDCTPSDFQNLSRKLLSVGTGLYMPTLVGGDYDKIEKVTESAAAAAEHNIGAKIIGIHIEGTFISPQKSGIMDKKYIYLPDIKLVDRLLQYRLPLRFTVAPETEGAMEFIEYAVNHGCFVSLGHSCCNYETAVNAFEKGANCITHLFNAMLPLNHREPNLVGMGLTSNAYCEVICDTYHISKSVLSLIYKAKGEDKGIIISDSMNAAGMPDGKYRFCGKDIFVKNGRATDENGTLAGSVCTMQTGAKNMFNITHNPQAVLKWAVSNPAQAVGITNHNIEPGNSVPMLLLDSNFNIKEVF